MRVVEDRREVQIAEGDTVELFVRFAGKAFSFCVEDDEVNGQPREALECLALQAAKDMIEVAEYVIRGPDGTLLNG